MSTALETLTTDELDHVLLHPVQRTARNLIEGLIADLRSCETPADYEDFQRLLFQQIYTAEEARARVRRVVKRLRQGKQVPLDAPDLPPGLAPSDPNAWRLEDITWERVIRQLRSVGDALAWRVVGFDRRYILALSRNSPPGPMVGKKGLESELGAIVELWDGRGHFTLLHDLTSCLRIGDITEFTSDGRRLVGEVKRSGKASPAQVTRMEQAVRAVNDGTPLPGSTQRLVQVDTPLSTHLDLLEVALELADKRGIAGVKGPGGRAIVAANGLTLAQSSVTQENAPTVWATERERTLRRAGIATDTHHLNMRTADWAARAPEAVPFGIYPISPGHCADLICDFSIIDLAASVDSLVAAAEHRGLQGEVLLPEASGDLGADQSLFRLSKRSARSIVVHSGVVHQLLAELVTTDCFLDALEAILTEPDLPPNPVLIYRDELSVWE